MGNSSPASPKPSSEPRTSTRQHHSQSPQMQPRVPPTSPRSSRFVLQLPPVDDPSFSTNVIPAANTGVTPHTNTSDNESFNSPTSNGNNNVMNNYGVSNGNETVTMRSPPPSARVRFQIPGLPLDSLKNNQAENGVSNVPVSVRFPPRKPFLYSSKSPPMSPRVVEEAPKEVKIFHFYHRGSQQDLKVYVGTPVELIWRTLFQQLGILQSGGTNFESLMDNVTLLDGDGCPVVFSPEHIPHYEKLYVQFNVTVQPANDKPVESEASKGEESNNDASEHSAEELEFDWDSKWNSLYCGYVLLDDDRTVTCGNTVLSRSTSMPILISSRCFKKGTGIYKWRVVFKQEMTYHAAGIVSEEEISFPRKCASFGNHFPSIPLFFQTAPMGVKNTVIILDTNKSKVTINGKVFEGIPDSVYAAICFKMPHPMEARLLFDVE